MSKICSKCHIEKNEKDFPRNGTRLHSWCKECHRVIVNERYKETRDFVNSFKKECSICGYRKNKAALEFHHPDNNKETTINALAKKAIKNKDRIIKEMEKCIIVCANCHREIHYPQLNQE